MATKKVAATTTATKSAKTSAKKSAKKSAVKKPSAMKAPAMKSSSVSPWFTDEAQRFIGELARRQDREWFTARKEQFKALLESPMKALLAAVGPLLLDTFPAVEDATPKVFRIYRDTRFSADKSPYKSHVGGEFSIGRGGFYFHIAGDEIIGAVGLWQMEPEVLQRYRRRLVDDSAFGAALLKETLALEKKGFRLMSMGELVRAPAGVSPTHPCIKLLKHKGWAMMLPMTGINPMASGLPAALALQAIQTKKALGLVDDALSGRSPDPVSLR